MRHSQKFRIAALTSATLIIVLLPAVAFVPAITISPVSFTLYGRQTLTLQGNVGQICHEHPVHISRKQGAIWRDLGKASVSQSSQWRLDTKVPNVASSVVYRASCGAQYSASLVRKITKTSTISYSGPGRRIVGLDISRWQHIPRQTINFEQMADAGISFVIIKASDGYGPEDTIAKKYVIDDARRAKAAGLIVGYYHMISVPTGNARATLIGSANRQASLVSTRLRELGGYDVRTLPFTIDVEGINSSISQASLELWTKTFVTAFTKKTKRTPMLYSYRSLLATRYSRSESTISFLRTMHLWLAQPGNPADPTVRVGQFRPNDGSCFHTAWATSRCRTVWTIWQYTSRGNRDTFGIPWSPQRGSRCPSQAKYCIAGVGTGPLHLDMNVFNGKIADLEALVAGSWQRKPADFVEPTATPSFSSTP